MKHGMKARDDHENRKKRPISNNRACCFCFLIQDLFAQSAEAVEYTDCFSTEG